MFRCGPRPYSVPLLDVVNIFLEKINELDKVCSDAYTSTKMLFFQAKISFLFS